MTNLELLQDYINDHRSDYGGKYRYRCHYKVAPAEEKFRYYMLDETFRDIELFVNVSYHDVVSCDFSINLKAKEREYIIKDALGRILANESVAHHLSYEDYESDLTQRDDLTPHDYMNLFDYMKYHKGVNKKTIDKFYDIFMPFLDGLVEQKAYGRYLTYVEVLLKHAVYHYEWEGPTQKYYDCEYEHQLYYFRHITDIIYQNMETMYQEAPDKVLAILTFMMKENRFSFLLLANLGRLDFKQSPVIDAIGAELDKRFVLFDKNKPHPDMSLFHSYIYSVYHHDEVLYNEVIKQIFRNITNNMMCFANSDLDYALGIQLLKEKGYGVLLELFNEDFNSLIFTCFPISSFPEEMKIPIRQELEKAVVFFAARMENDKYRMSSFDQIVNINRLFLDNYREWYE